MTEKRSERISDVVNCFPQNLNMPRVSSIDAATLSVQDLVEALKQSTPNATFAKINDTYHTAQRNPPEIFSVIPKAVKQQSTNNNNGRRSDVENKPEQAYINTPQDNSKIRHQL